MRYQFNNFELDTDSLKLTRSGVSVSLEPQVLDLLFMLLQERNRVVHKDEIYARIWKGRVVSDAALSSRIKTLRQALDDDGRTQHTIRTVHKKGFQFVAQIREKQCTARNRAESPEIQSGRAFPEENEGNSGDKESRPSIAILPFKNLSGEDGKDFLGAGITEDIITALSKISSLAVIASNSTAQYREKEVDIKAIGVEQGVEHILEGSVRVAGERVRVNAKLIDCEAGSHLWAETYDRELGDLFAVQDDIVKEIIVALDIQLREGEQARFWSSGTDNLKAWECVRLGTEMCNEYSTDNIPKITRYAERAIELDPNYAAAWVLMAWLYCHINEDSSRPEAERNQANEKMRDAAFRALELDATCAEACSILGIHYLSSHDFEKAVEYGQRSVELGPNHASNLVVSAPILNKCGDPGRAIERIQKAMRLSPVHPTWFPMVLGQAYRLAGLYEESIAMIQEVVRRQPDSLNGHLYLAALYTETDQLQKAVEAAKAVLRINPDFSVSEYVNGLAFRNPEESTNFENALLKARLPE